VGQILSIQRMREIAGQSPRVAPGRGAKTQSQAGEEGLRSAALSSEQPGSVFEQTIESRGKERKANRINEPIRECRSAMMVRNRRNTFSRIQKDRIFGALDVHLQQQVAPQQERNRRPTRPS
jgi:hypothetical protein